MLMSESRSCVVRRTIGMATWQFIESAGQSLVRILQRHVDAVLPLAGVRAQLATTRTFSALDGHTEPVITVLLYRVLEHAELRNAPPRVLADGTTTRPLLPLELCYLVTPWGVRRDESPASDALAAEEEHRLLGVILQAAYDHPEIGRAELFETAGASIWSPTDSLQLILESLPLEDHHRIWDSSELSYRLSVTYRLRVLGLEPSRRTRTSPVSEADFGYGVGP